MPTIHEPALLKEILTYFDPQSGENFIDCTFGGGGHALAILDRIKPQGKLLGIDWDQSVIQDSRNDNLVLASGNYKNLKNIYEHASDNYNLGEISGILLDLGLSSDQLEDEARGFGFDSVGKLDMRFDRNSGAKTAAEILMASSEQGLVKIFEDYGEEPLARQIAKAIVLKRQKGEDIQSAEILVQLISDIYRRRFHRPSKRNPASPVVPRLFSVRPRAPC